MNQLEAKTQVRFDRSTLERFPANIALAGKPIDFYVRPNSAADKGVARQIFESHDYGMRSVRLFERVIRLYNTIILNGKIPLIIDAGANIGASILYWRYQFPEAKIIAIEPAESNCSILRINCEDMGDLELFEGAISNTDEPLFLSDPGRGDWGFRADKLGDIEVPATTITHLMERQKEGVVPFLVKIDIEGGEDRLFASEANWAKQTPCIVAELHDWLFPGKAVSKNFYRCISAFNFDIINRGENTFALNNELLPKVESDEIASETARLLSMSLRQYKAREFEKCIVTAKNAIALKPDFAPAYNNICAANNHLGNFAEGKKAAEQALRIDPNNQLAKNNLAWSERELNKKAFN